MKIIRRIKRWFRSAITGKFVSKPYADANPDTTIEQRLKAALDDEHNRRMGGGE